jgi:hypothetical protein
MHGEGDAPRQTLDVAARPAITNSIWLSGRKVKLALRRVARAFACASCCPPSQCAAQHCVRLRTLRCRWQQRLARDVLYTSTRRCNGARRGARRGRSLQSAVWAVASLPAGSASTDGTSVGTRSSGRDGARGRRGGGGGCEAAGGVHLPLRRLVCCKLPIVFRGLLRRPPARARLLRSSVSAVRRSAALPEEVVLDGPVGAAEQQLRDGCRIAFVRGTVQRRAPARPTAAGTRPAHSSADSPQAQTAHPKSSLAFTAASASTSDPIIRRLP